MTTRFLGAFFCFFIQSMIPALAQSCPPDSQLRALEQRRDPLGTYCMRVGQAQIARKKCAGARSAIDLDECQYLTKSLVSTLRDCAALGGPYGAKCAAMIGQAQALLGGVARSPTLQRHRQDQRDTEAYGNRCRANIGVQCSSRCGGDANCMASCNGGNAWQCN